MGYSYQDLDSRLRIVEDRLDFVMRQFTITKQIGIIAPKIVTLNLLDLYREVKALGAAVSFIDTEKLEDATDTVDNRRADEGLSAPAPTEGA